MEHFEVDPDDYIDGYNQMLDEVYGAFMGSYSASYVLKCVDETAWRCGLSDYVDALEISYPNEWDDDLEELQDELRDLIANKIEELDEYLGDLEDPMDDYKIKEQIKYLEELQDEWC